MTCLIAAVLTGDAAMRFDHGFIQICPAVGLQIRQLFGDPLAFAHGAKRQRPIPIGVEGEDAHLVGRIHDIGGGDGRGLGEVELRAALATRAHAARFIDDEQQRDVRHFQFRRRAHVDRQDALQRRPEISAGAIALRAADDQ